MIKKIIFILSVFIFITAVFIKFLKPQYILNIEDKTNKKNYEFVLKNKTFSLGYTHSVMKTEAEEFFTADERQNIKLVKTEYSSYGVGLPFLPQEGRTEIKNGKFILYMDREFKNISMVISAIGKHYLKIDGQKYMLTDILGDKPAKILLTIKKDYRF